MSRDLQDWKTRVTRPVAAALMRHGFPGSSILLRNAYRLMGSGPGGPRDVETMYGFLMEIDPRRNKGVDASIYFNGTYEAGTVQVIIDTLRPGDVFVDAGANIGLMSLAACQAVGPQGQVHSFEPVPEVHAVLTRNLALNDYRHALANRQALGLADEERTIYEQPEINNGSASFVRPAKSGVPSHVVELVSLDRYLERAGVETVRMIKADVEGWELEMMRGASGLLSRADAPALCVEYSTAYSPTREQLPELYEFLKSINRYRFFKLKHGKEVIAPLVQVHHPSELPYHDNVFCFLPSQIEEIGSRLFDRS